MSRRSRLTARPALERLDSRLVLSTLTTLTPSQIQAAYGLNSVTFSSNGKTVAGTGAGQTIAIIDAYNDPNAATELATFDAKYGLPAASLTVDNLGSARNTNAGWEEEEALDIEAAHLAAPGAKILLIEATSASTADLMAAVQVANTTPGVTVVSMSWGGSDTRTETMYDSDFTTPGITYLAASGDNGAGAEWPADSPNVIGVGGTTLTVNTSSTGVVTRGTEVAWSDSGGGESNIESEPSFQDKAQSTGRRSSPDVSAVANPSTGLEMYTVAGGGFVQVGGTSLATPIWAGLIAVADQGRALAGKATLNSSVALGDLYNAPSGSFNDITSGARATTSFDTSTGLGTPNAAVLVAALVADPSTTASTTGNGVGGDPLPTTTTTTGGGTTTTTGGGTTGGGTTTPPQFPWWPPFGGRGFFGNPGSYPGSGSLGGWAGATLPKNSGQAAPNPFEPTSPIVGSGGFTVSIPTPTPMPAPTTPVEQEPTAPVQKEPTKPSAPEKTKSTKHETTKPTESKTKTWKTTTAKEHAVDSVIHSLGHARR